MRSLLAADGTCRPVPGGLYFRGPRPGPGWHAHGTTTKRIHLLLDEGGTTEFILYKQRWKHVPTGVTCHDRPLWEVAWSRSGIALIATVLSAWLLGGDGLHRARWPWPDDRPSRRTAQRWLRRMRDDTTHWLAAVRVALIDLLAPRPLEEVLPTAGIPPPGGRARRNQGAANGVSQLRSSLWLCIESARVLDIPVRTLLVEARRRWTLMMHGTKASGS